MIELYNLFPYPLLIDNAPRDGLLVGWPAECTKIIPAIVRNKTIGQYFLDSMGFNYVRIDNRIVCAGILLRQFGDSSPARAKLLRTRSQPLLDREDIDRAIEAFQTESARIERSTKEKEAAQIEDYISKEKYKSDFLARIKPEIERNLSFVHDYKQINAQIAQNITVIIEKNRKGETFDAKVEDATEQEKAIYYGSRLLSDKLLVSRSLLSPEWLDRKSSCHPFRFHGLATKYIKIYESFFRRKLIRVSTLGASTNDINANAEAVSVIVHTFIDNAIKYSPKESNVDITIQDDDESVDFSIGSYGPRIERSEMTRIFDPFYRGVHAKEQEEEGAGYGLYVSQLIAKRHLGVEISVNQDLSRSFKGCFWTTFSIRLPGTAEIA